MTLNDNTPLERYDIHGVAVYVKREDLCWPFPPISKARGVWKAIEFRPNASTLAVVDTGRSVNGLLVSTIGLEFKRKIIVGYPQYVADPTAIPGPTLAIKSLAPAGVELIPIPANRQFVMHAAMRRHLQLNGNSFLFPTGLRLPETVVETERQVRKVCRDLCPCTVIVPTGTGTHLAGVLRGYEGHIIGVQGYARPEARFRSDVARMADVPLAELRERLHVVTTLCDYYEAKPDLLPPWPSNVHYEVKAYKWLLNNSMSSLAPLKQPILFWNIGQ